jgi:hypothetical protein
MNIPELPIQVVGIQDREQTELSQALSIQVRLFLRLEVVIHGNDIELCEALGQYCEWFFSKSIISRMKYRTV